MFIFKNFDGINKKCPGCKEWKSVSEFGKEKRSSSGLKPRCKECCNEYYNSKYVDFRDNKLKTCKKRYDSNPEIIKEYAKKRYWVTREVSLERRRIYGLNNKDKIKAQAKKYHDGNKFSNLRYRAVRNYRRLFYRMKINKNGKRTAELLGFSYDELILKLGREPDVSESIDHKVPVSWFLDLSHVKLINHLDNLQLLTTKENSKKLNTYAHPISFEYFELIKDIIKPEYLNKITYGNAG